MQWTILNVSIPVNDLKKSMEFYEMILGPPKNEGNLYQSLFENEENVFFGKQGFGLRLFKPKPDLVVSNYIQSRRSYISILVDNINSIKGNLDRENIHYIFNNFSVDLIWYSYKTKFFLFRNNIYYIIIFSIY